VLKQRCDRLERRVGELVAVLDLLLRKSES
jgi:hypothetical protein